MVPFVREISVSFFVGCFTYVSWCAWFLHASLLYFFYVGCIYRATTPVNYKINSEHFLISSGRVAAAKLVAEL